MTVLYVVAGIVAVIVFLKVVSIKEVPRGDPKAVAKSAAVRERIYGEARLKKYGDMSAEQRPKAERLWERARGRVDELIAAADAKGMAVFEDDIGVEIKSSTGGLFLNVDVTQLDPIFLMWTEEDETGESSDLYRIKRLREVTERVSAWIEGQEA
jgi:hypothetical protein